VRPRTPGRLQPDACTAADHHYDLPGQFRFTPLRNGVGALVIIPPTATLFFYYRDPIRAPRSSSSGPRVCGPAQTGWPRGP
jgi:hypothetical protein